MTKFTKFNLDPILRQIVSGKNKKFIKELQSVEISEERIDEILTRDYQRSIYSYPIFPRAKILECKKNCFRLSYSMRRINALLDDENILDITKNRLLKELNRLRNLYDKQKWIADLESGKKYIGPGNPKTWEQMIGFQIRSLYEYLRPLTETLNGKPNFMGLKYTSQDIFKLITELLNVGEVKFASWKQIKTMYGNAKRQRGPNPGQPIKGTKISNYEWEKIQKAH